MAHILIIEDEQAMRDALQKILTRAGHQVNVASNGKEGVSRAVALVPSVVITDIFMPDKDGIETIIALRRAYPDMKIIAVSGGGRASNFDFLELAKRAGAHAVLQKPVRMADLLDQVNRLLASAD